MKSYILGTRKKYYSPLKYLFIWTAIYFFFFKVNADTKSIPIGESINNATRPFSAESITDYGTVYLKVIVEHTDLFYLAMVPFLTLVSYFLYRKYQYLYTELIVCYLYICGQVVFLILITALTTSAFGKTALPLVMLFSLLAILYLFIKMHKQMFMQTWVLTVAKSLTVLYDGQILFGLTFYFIINVAKMVLG